jgi:hypothetical protein
LQITIVILIVYIRNNLSRFAMAVVLIDFDWWRDSRGYRLVQDRPSAPADGETSPPLSHELIPHPLGNRVVFESKPIRLVRLGGDLIHYRPLERFETLFKIFANEVRAPRDVLDFVQKFGPLTTGGHDENIGEPVYDTIVHAEGMREFFYYIGGDNRRLQRGIDAQLNPLGRIDFSLDFDPATARPRLMLSPSDLLDALWLQFGQMLSGDSPLRRCQHCGEWFESGVRTGRRADAKFCSDEHRISFNSLKRSKKG